MAGFSSVSDWLFRVAGFDPPKVELAAGAALLGTVGIDQTTPGTTDSVSVATGQGAGATIGVTSGAAVITDATGTLQQYLRGIVKLAITAGGFLVRGSVASGGVASGAVASGAIASGAVASGAIASGAIVDGANVVEGATADAAIITDTTGTMNGKLRGLIKLATTAGSFLVRGSVASGGVAAGALATGAAVDGWDLTQGALADAAVITDATGSISAKLRGLIALWLGGLKASSAIIGNVRIDQTTPGTTNRVDIGAVGALEATTPAEYNVTLTSANTEYSQALPANTRRLCFRCRTGAVCRYAWVTGKVAAPTANYQTLQAGAEYGIDGLKLAASTLYLASATAGVIIELEVWT